MSKEIRPKLRKPSLHNHKLIASNGHYPDGTLPQKVADDLNHALCYSRKTVFYSDDDIYDKSSSDSPIWFRSGPAPSSGALVARLTAITSLSDASVSTISPRCYFTLNGTDSDPIYAQTFSSLGRVSIPEAIALNEYMYSPATWTMVSVDMAIEPNTIYSGNFTVKDGLHVHSAIIIEAVLPRLDTGQSLTSDPTRYGYGESITDDQVDRLLTHADELWRYQGVELGLWSSSDGIARTVGAYRNLFSDNTTTNSGSYGWRVDLTGLSHLSSGNNVKAELAIYIGNTDYGGAFRLKYAKDGSSVDGAHIIFGADDDNKWFYQTITLSGSGNIKIDPHVLVSNEATFHAICLYIYEPQ